MRLSVVGEEQRGGVVRVLIVVGSTRPVRVGDQIAEAVAEVARSVEGVEPVVEDLRERALPLLDEPVVPAAAEGEMRHEHTRAWAETVGSAGAVVLVTPQYNGGYPAGLKNAVDYLYREWQGKPALVVSYGSEASDGGRSANDQLSHVLRVVGADLHEPGVAIPLSFGAYGAGGRLVDAELALAGSTDDLRAALNALVAAGDGVGA
jgi:NAD(P)H-dependent FMN reductase